MLENKIRTPEELKKYMLDLKKWLAQERDKPIEEMADFFSNRIDNYDNVHLNNWAEEYAHIADYFEYPLEAEKYDAALSFETLHHFKYSKKQKIYDKLFQTIKCGGYYIECDYVACCLDEEILCLEQYEFKRKENHIPDDVFVHIDIPLTLEHQIQLMKNAGFRNVHILYENKSTMIIKAEK